eukprot:TRINITY_DN1735_c0_g2_i2.p1 TRINITY_DN1735_c0_g2~~TRINITY_DN1735_c0_g2_i2.p1  ORF type:complete len:716 (+),score=212.12 TRINITY_DN1735_c0_g2_i2:935-3082(+)
MEQASPERPQLLQFQTFSSTVNATFWHELAQRKLERYKLSEEPVGIVGSYCCSAASASSAQLASAFMLDDASFVESATNAADAADAADPAALLATPPRWGQVAADGTLHNANTLDGLQRLDKRRLFDQLAAQMWHEIESGAALAAPERLVRFVLVSYADLKAFKFYYWFAWPALAAEPPLSVSRPPCALHQHFTAAEIEELSAGWAACAGLAFVAGLRRRAAAGTAGPLSLGPLSAAAALWAAAGDSDERLVGLIDPGTQPQSPGWPARNLLLLIARQFPGLRTVTLVCWRDMPNAPLDASRSRVFAGVLLPTDAVQMTMPKAFGWEANHQGQYAPRMVSLASSMQPQRLAASAVELNLQLIRWRLLPSLDLAKVSGTRCLLLGAGTLGCNVARALMAWGVRHITLVDSGRVSFSNPVRQPLFHFADCLDGGKPKALAAADELKAIFPGMQAQGVELHIAMPGHPVSPGLLDQTRASVARLEALIAEHDAVFLLLDSREARWLPTLIAASHGKLVINAALGFDTLLVMRHGVNHSPSQPSQPSQPASAGTTAVAPDSTGLGCYFCNDVVAPQNSLQDRSLDQQCTVTRPGLSAMCSALAVEMLVSLLHHPLGVHAPADVACDISQTPEHEFGLIPHSIRGFLTHFTNLLVVGHAFDRCTACSRTVVELYRRDGFDFVLKAFNNPTYLEDVTGITDVKKELADISWEPDDDTDFDL